MKYAVTIAAGLAFVLAALLPAPVAAEPAGYEYFHTYAEAVAAIDATVANHPSLAEKFSLGQSYNGRAIWAIKLTADIDAGDQGRPVVFVNAMIHGRERAAGEMAIYVMTVLTDNYGDASTKLGRRATRILDNTVVYIVPMANPDGAVYDFKNNTLHSWRKNRQPIPNSSQIGIDLNRQFGFKWGCCGGSSGKPSSDTYRGPEPWYAPEVRAYRDFVASHEISEILSIHSAAARVLWPYGYTLADVPSTMTQDDHDTLVALGRGMASRNGYRASQSSDMYISDGDQDDWAYYSQGILALTLELSAGSALRYYPSQSELSADLERNRGAVLWFLEQAACPYRPAGLAGQYCATTSGMQSMSLAEGKRTATLARAGRSTD